MSRFLTLLRVEHAVDTADGKWILVSPLIYDSDVANHVVIVPEGFQTDFASVPRLPLVYLAVGNMAQEAAVVHDYLYNTHQVSRKMADDMFHEAAQVGGVSRWQSWMLWAGVRIGGGAYWKEPPVASVEATY